MAPDTAHTRPPISRARRTRTGPERVPANTGASGGGTRVLGFIHALGHLNGARIELQAATLKARRPSDDDDIAWWDATLMLDRALRHGGLKRRAAMVSQLAAHAVLDAAARAGLAPTAEVSAVARSAAETARVLAAGDLINAGSARYLSRDWRDLLESG